MLMIRETISLFFKERIRDKIVIIDHDVQFFKRVQPLLNKWGYKVHFAHNVVTGFRKIQTLKPKGILIDIMMPGIDGWQTLQRLRDMTETPIIILQTSKFEDEEILKGLRLGVTDFLLKSMTDDELDARIKTIVISGIRGIRID